MNTVKKMCVLCMCIVYVYVYTHTHTHTHIFMLFLPEIQAEKEHFGVELFRVQA